MKYDILYKLTPTELKGKPNEGHHHPAWGEEYQGWWNGYTRGTLEEALKTAHDFVGCYGRQWRIIEREEDENGTWKIKSVQTSPEAAPYVEPPPEEVKEPQLPGFVSTWKKVYPNLSKEEMAIAAVLYGELFRAFIDQKATKEERAAWSKLILNILQNEVMPFAEEMGLEEVPYRVQWGLEENKGDKCNLPYFMELMRNDIRDVAMLRFCGFVTAAQAKQLVRDCWLLGDITNAIKALKLDEEVKEDDLLDIVKTVLKTNPKIVADYKGGKANAANSLLGPVIKKAKEANKSVDPVAVKTLVLTTLNGM